MKTVTISELRARLLNYLSSVQHGEVITVTSKGTALATLSPPVSQQHAAGKKLDDLAKTAVIHDVVSPIEEGWDAIK